MSLSARRIARKGMRRTLSGKWVPKDQEPPLSWLELVQPGPKAEPKDAEQPLFVCACGQPEDEPVFCPITQQDGVHIPQQFHTNRRTRRSLRRSR